MRTWITRHGDDGDGADEDGMHDGVDHNMDEDGTIKHGKRHQREEHGGHEGIDLSEQGSWEGRREHEGPRRVDLTLMRHVRAAAVMTARGSWLAGRFG